MDVDRLEGCPGVGLIVLLFLANNRLTTGLVHGLNVRNLFLRNGILIILIHGLLGIRGRTGGNIYHRAHLSRGGSRGLCSIVHHVWRTELLLEIGRQ